MFTKNRNSIEMIPGVQSVGSNLSGSHQTGPPGENPSNYDNTGTLRGEALPITVIDYQRGARLQIGPLKKESRTWSDASDSGKRDSKGVKGG